MDKRRIEENRSKVRFTYTVEQELLNKIKILAIESNMRTNELLDIIIKDFLKQVENEKKKFGKDIIPSKFLYRK